MVLEALVLDTQMQWCLSGSLSSSSSNHGKPAVHIMTHVFFLVFVIYIPLQIKFFIFHQIFLSFCYLPPFHDTLDCVGVLGI